MKLSPPQLEAVLLSDIGTKRKQNQDSGLCRPDLGLFIVADGMGGHLGGETASRLCVEKVCAHVEQNKTSEIDDTTLLHQGLLIANQEIYQYSQNDPALLGMGTTATVLKLSGNQATLLQVGDSRAYYSNPSGIWQLTRDHSIVQEKLRAGLISREQVKTDQMKNVITRSVGYEPNVKADAFNFEIAAGDCFLLCSDGLSGPVEDRLMFDILEESFHSGLNSKQLPKEVSGDALKNAATRLIDEANRRGGDDNSTVVLIKVSSTKER